MNTRLTAPLPVPVETPSVLVTGGAGMMEFLVRLDDLHSTLARMMRSAWPLLLILLVGLHALVALRLDDHARWHAQVVWVLAALMALIVLIQRFGTGAASQTLTVLDLFGRVAYCVIALGLVWHYTSQVVLPRIDPAQEVRVRQHLVAPMSVTVVLVVFGLLTTARLRVPQPHRLYGIVLALAACWLGHGYAARNGQYVAAVQALNAPAAAAAAASAADPSDTRPLLSREDSVRSARDVQEMTRVERRDTQVARVRARLQAETVWCGLAALAALSLYLIVVWSFHMWLENHGVHGRQGFEQVAAFVKEHHRMMRLAPMGGAGLGPGSRF